MTNPLHLSQDIYRFIVESTPNAIVMVDRAGIIVLVNSQTEKLFGYGRQELIGRPIEMLVPSRFREQHPGHRRGFHGDPRIRAMGAGRDLYGLRKDGTEVPVEIGLNPIETEQGVFVLAVIADITERKKAEERFRLAAEAAPNAMLMVGRDGKIILVNSQTERLFGYGRQELIGRPIEMLVPSRFREQHPGHRRQFDADPRTRAMGAGRDLYGLRKDGTEVPVEIGLNPIETAEGPCVLASVIDITERKKAEERLREYSSQVAANKELEAFSYSISHDLKAPLRHIDGFIGLLQKRSASLDEKSRQYLTAISDSAKKMGKLIEDLLSFSKMTRVELKKTKVSLDKLIKEVLRDLEMETEGRKIEWKIGKLPEIHCDPFLLRLVFVNLLENAVKFTQPRELAVIEVGTLHQSPSEAIVFVRDNGVGFDMRYADKLFGMFQRLHRDEEFEGTGIGLANVRRIIHRHGGNTWGESSEGSGATFYFSLPLKREEDVP